MTNVNMTSCPQRCVVPFIPQKKALFLSAMCTIDLLGLLLTTGILVLKLYIASCFVPCHSNIPWISMRYPKLGIWLRRHNGSKNYNTSVSRLCGSSSSSNADAGSDDNQLEEGDDDDPTVNDNDSDALYGYNLDVLKHRAESYKRKQAQELLCRPPNPFLGPHEFVTAILNALSNPHDPYHNAGFETLLQASTSDWRKVLFSSVGVNTSSERGHRRNNSDETRSSSSGSISRTTVKDSQVASALGPILSRPNNQFAILVGEEEKEHYRITFPTDPLDYDDGTCWIECRLRSTDEESRLLVVMGWSLQKRETDEAWLIQSIDWQDFREKYRPGIGREEWERICG